MRRLHVLTCLLLSPIACDGTSADPSTQTSLGGALGTGGTSLPAVGSAGAVTTGGMNATFGGMPNAAGGSPTLGGQTATSSGPATGGSSATGGSPMLGGASATSGSGPTGGIAAKGGSTSAGGTTVKGGSTSAGGTTAKGGSASAGGATSAGGTTAKGGSASAGGATSAGGTTAKGGSASAGGATSTGGTSTGGLPRLTVVGNHLEDPTGKTIILRGASLIDIGSLYAFNGNSATGITARIDKVIAAGLQGHVVRLPVYPKITYNAGFPACSPLAYPVGTGPTSSCTVSAPLSAANYVAQVLKPAVDYATSKGLYVIIDYHQIDNATTGTSAADATTFWTDIAPKFASYSNVFYEPFNEPIDGSASWATLKPVVQGFINTIRASAPSNIIIVPSNSYAQRPGDAASSPPTGTNLMYTAHIYPGNWSTTFKNQVTTALTKAPVFITEWGYVLGSSDAVVGTNDNAFGSTFRSTIDGNGASWVAWVTDNQWVPNLFTNSAMTTLSDFGTVTKNWLSATANSNWVN